MRGPVIPVRRCTMGSGTDITLMLMPPEDVQLAYSLTMPVSVDAVHHTLDVLIGLLAQHRHG
jgi:hypothetical protein